MNNWVLTPLRNGLPLTRKALPTFLVQDIGNVRVMFIDNASSDGTREWLWSQPDLLTMFNQRPMSVAKSWNTGLRFLFEEQTAEYVLVVNNDVELRPDTYRHLVADGGLFVTAVGASEHEKIDPPYLEPDPANKRPHPDFSCFLIRRECWEKVGPFDEEFVGGYCEDASYHVRLHKAGIHAEALELPFYHVASGTIKSSEPEMVEEIQRNAQANREYFKRKWGFEIGSKEYYDFFGNKAPQSALQC